MASHLADGVRSRYPSARIHWLVEPQIAPLVKHHPCLDGLVIWPKQRWKTLGRTGKFVSLLREVVTFVRGLRRERFDMVIDAQGLLRTRIMAWLSGAPERVGLDSREPGGGLMTRLISRGEPTHRMGSEYFHLLNQLGVVTTELRQSIHLAPSSYVEAAELLAAKGVAGPYLAFAPFTTRPQKHWFEELWAQLAQKAAAALSLPVVWLGGPADHDAALRLAAAGGGINLAGAADLGTTAAIIAKASLLVGVDTGLTHMGTAFSIPTVALFGSTCPYLTTLSPATVVIYHGLPCSPCRRSPICDGRYDCMGAITVDEVMQTIHALLETGEQI